MDRRTRTNLVLAAMVAALGALIVLAPQPEQAAEIRLFTADQDLEHIAVFNGDALHLALLHEAGEWRVTEPFRLRADEFQVNALLDSLRQPASRRYDADDANLAELGLAQPAWKLRVDGAEIFIGDRTAIGNDRYLLKDGNVYLASDVLSYRVQRAPLDYASRRVLPEDGIAFMRLPSGVELARAGGGWSVSPANDSVSADSLQRFVDAWRHATAMDVIPADSVPRDGEVLIRFADGRELRFGVEAGDAELKLTRAAPAVTYILPAGAANDLLQPATEE